MNVKLLLISMSICIICIMILLYKYTKNVEKYFNPLPKTILDDFIKNSQTGDLVFFWSDNSKYGIASYGNYITSSLQALATETPYTHVCLVYKHNDNVYFITSDRVLKPDIITGTKKSGNQMLNAEEYIKEYKGRMCWRRLPNASKISSELISKAFEEFKSRIDYTYYLDLLMLTNLGLQIWVNKNKPKKTICSTTVYDFLNTIGVITPDNIYAQMNKMNIGVRELNAAIDDIYSPPVEIIC